MIKDINKHIYFNFLIPESKEGINEIINFFVEQYGFRKDNTMFDKSYKYIYAELSKDNKRIFGYSHHAGGLWTTFTKEIVMEQAAKRFEKRFMPPPAPVGKEYEYPYGY